MTDSYRDNPVATKVSAYPEPDKAARVHSQRLSARIRQEIKDGKGRIPFDRYMELALYAPGLGYYVAGQRKFGEAGDFITAPEVSPLFAQCLARQSIQILEKRPEALILEFGAGSGLLAADLLREMAALGHLPRRYLILELSPELRRRQQQTLAACIPNLRDRVEWLDATPEKRFSGIVLANEVLDAMPVQRFRLSDHGVQEAFVECDERQFRLRWGPVENPELKRNVKAIQSHQGPLPEGYESEVNLRAQSWIRMLGQALESGVVFVIDYGYPRAEYYLPERDRGTLMCHYRHRAHADPFTWIGIQDITAHVDFSSIAEVALEAGLSVIGFTTQTHFLIGCGLEQLVSRSDPADVGAHLELMQAVKRLTLPSEMGERFKVLALGRDWGEALIGFAQRDMRHRL